MSEAFHDIAIAGGGPAGALLAALLAQSGRRVLLLEASTQDKRKVCGEYLCPKGVELLHALGFARALDGREVRGMRLFSPGGTSVESRFPGGQSGLTCRRDLLDPALLGCALGAGAEVRRGARLESFRFQEGCWALSAGGETFRSRLLVGADGRQSLVARRLGVTEPVRSKRVALHFFARTEEETSPWGEMHILPGGAYVGISPAGKHELNVSLVLEAGAMKGGARAQETLRATLSLSADLRRRFLPLANPTAVFVSYPISHSVSAVAGESWALVGDAAGFLDPLTGEGIYQALRSAQLLAQSLSRAYGERRESLAQSLAHYTRAHQQALRGKTRVNRIFQTLIRHPRACNWVGDALSARPARADAFIGIVGNVYSPAEGLRKMFFAPKE